LKKKNIITQNTEVGFYTRSRETSSARKKEKKIKFKKLKNSENSKKFEY